MVDTRTVVEFMSRRGYRPLTLDALARQLGAQDDATFNQLQAVVARLEADGVIVRKKKQKLGLASNADFMVGRMDLKRGGFGFVRPLDEDRPDVYIGRDSVGESLDGDLVLIEKSRKRGGRQGALERGKVVQIVERGRTRMVGTLQRWRDRPYVIPDGMSFPAELGLIDGDAKGAEPGDKVLIELADRPGRGRLGRILKVLGNRRDPAVDLPLILAEFSLPGEFPREVVQQVDAIPTRLSAMDFEGREDLRERLIVTIDPENAQDFDDAISLTRSRDGWSLGVHIADVSHYVRPGTAVWEEAFDRGTSVYLPRHTIPMIPEKLSNDLCSLRPDEDRLTLSALMDLDRNAVVRRYRVVRSVIRSAKRLTYAEAFDMIEGKGTSLNGPVVKLLKDAARLAKVRNDYRMRRGALELELPEVKLEYDDEGHLKGAHPYERNIAHRLIEEFMLLANECVAEFGEKNKRAFLYRIHGSPDGERIGEFFQFARSLGLSADTSDPRRALQEVLKRVEGKPLEHAVNLVALKSMKHAEYDPVNQGHYALAAEHYCHFTSPIRRFPDLVVHAALKDFDLEKGRYVNFAWGPHMDRYARHSSEMERRAENAERELVNLKLLRFVENRIGEKMTGVIVGVEEFGAFVELDEIPVEGLIPVRALADHYDHDKRRRTLVGRRRKNRLALGDRVKVIIDAIDLDRRELDLTWIP